MKSPAHLKNPSHRFEYMSPQLQLWKTQNGYVRNGNSASEVEKSHISVNSASEVEKATFLSRSTPNHIY